MEAAELGYHKGTRKECSCNLCILTRRFKTMLRDELYPAAIKRYGEIKESGELGVEVDGMLKGRGVEEVAFLALVGGVCHELGRLASGLSEKELAAITFSMKQGLADGYAEGYDDRGGLAISIDGGILILKEKDQEN